MTLQELIGIWYCTNSNYNYIYDVEPDGMYVKLSVLQIDNHLVKRIKVPAKLDSNAIVGTVFTSWPKFDENEKQNLIKNLIQDI
jgi:hypothetical protein